MISKQISARIEAMYGFEAKVWFIYLNDERVGPVSLLELQKMFADGKINLSTNVWNESMSAPAAIEATPSIASLFTGSDDPEEYEKTLISPRKATRAPVSQSPLGKVAPQKTEPEQVRSLGVERMDSQRQKASTLSSHPQNPVVQTQGGEDPSRKGLGSLMNSPLMILLGLGLVVVFVWGLRNRVHKTAAETNMEAIGESSSSGLIRRHLTRFSFEPEWKYLEQNMSPGDFGKLKQALETPLSLGKSTGVLVRMTDTDGQIYLIIATNLPKKTKLISYIGQKGIQVSGKALIFKSTVSRDGLSGLGPLHHLPFTRPPFEVVVTAMKSNQTGWAQSVFEKLPVKKGFSDLKKPNAHLTGLYELFFVTLIEH